MLLIMALPWTGSAFMPSSFSSASLSPSTPALGSLTRGFQLDSKSAGPLSSRPSRAESFPVHSTSLSAHSTAEDRQPAWPRRLWSKITRKRPLHMQVMDHDVDAPLLGSVVRPYTNTTSYDFILRELETIPQQTILPQTTIDSEFYNVSLGPTEQVKANKFIFVSRWTGKILENILTSILQRHATEPPEDLRVQAFPNDMASLLRGQFRTDAKLNVGRLVFPAIRISSGRLEVQRLTLQLGGFLGQSSTRFPKQFDIHAHDWVFSQQDLLLSPCIRNGLRRLLVRILRDRGVQLSSIQVTSIDVLVSRLWNLYMITGAIIIFFHLFHSHNVFQKAIWKDLHSRGSEDSLRRSPPL